MIGRITGRLAEKNPPQILIDVSGVGYELEVPMSTFYGLPANGQTVSLATHLAVREDGHFLYGFASEDERAAFRQLLKVAGIGARTALAVLSGLSVNDLAQAIAMQETGRLIKIPGIGKKTAERLLQPGRSLLQRRVVAGPVHLQGQAKGRRGADQRRAAHPHVGNGTMHGRDVAQPFDLQPVRQGTLVDDEQRVARRRRPQGAHRTTIDLHRRLIPVPARQPPAADRPCRGRGVRGR